MKSYYKHLTSIEAPDKPIWQTRKPVYRASAIFPVMENEIFSSKVVFMGYWILKRDIKEIALLYTLRNQHGEIVNRSSMTIDKPKAYSIKISDLTKEKNFVGSIELEIFSTQNLVFPYPGFVLSYYNKNFTTAVHTTGRIYNDIEDLKENNETNVAESGFDIYPNSEIEPFFTFTNGPFEEKNTEIKYILINHENKASTGSFRLETLRPYETTFVFLKKFMDLKFLGDQPGVIKISHNFRGFFPRFVAGNFQNDFPVASITHTYYDTSASCSNADYWRKIDQNFHDSSVYIPLFINDDFYTDVVFYPIYSPSEFQIDLQFFDGSGNILKEILNFTRINSKKTTLQKLNFKEIAEEINGAVGVNIIQNATEGNLYPARIKMGLNVGQTNKPVKIPCNICFNAQVGNPEVAKKTRSFKWAPLLNGGNSVIVITNSAPMKNYYRSATVKLKFFREKDDNQIEKTIEIQTFGQARIEVDKSPDLILFFENTTGWIVAESENPYIFLWYFDISKSGAIAGDHCF